MKKIVTVTEVEGEGLMSFMGKRIFIMAQSFFYVGTLTGVNTSCVLLEDAKVVLESGDFSKKGVAYAESVKGGRIYVQTSAIEAFFESHE